MKSPIKLCITTGIVLLLTVSGIFAQEGSQRAIIRELMGTVELKFAGSAAWVPAARGQAIAVDTVVSTGFKSSALIAVGDSQITVRPLTRLSFKEIRERSGTEIETINMNLQAGRVRAEVRPPAGTRASFTVQSPTATASVRGTVFELSTNELRVIEGTVGFFGNHSAFTSTSASTSSSTPSPTFTSAFTPTSSLVLVDAGGEGHIDEKTGRAINPKMKPGFGMRPDMPVGSEDILVFTQNSSLNYSPVSIQVTFKQQ